MTDRHGGCGSVDRTVPPPRVRVPVPRPSSNLLPGSGLPGVDRLLLALAGTVAAERPEPGRPGEFTVTLLEEMARRYRRALRAHARGGPVPEAWRVVFEAAAQAPGRVALAAVTVLVDHDLPVAVVSAGTLLDHRPGEHERRRVAALTALLVQRAHEDACSGTAVECLPGAGSRSWLQAERLWALRGRPAAAAAERAALDRRVAVHGRAVLAGGAC